MKFKDLKVGDKFSRKGPSQIVWVRVEDNFFSDRVSYEYNACYDTDCGFQAAWIDEEEDVLKHIIPMDPPDTKLTIDVTGIDDVRASFGGPVEKCIDMFMEVVRVEIVKKYMEYDNSKPKF